VADSDRIAFATYADVAGCSPDDRLAVSELERRGIEVTPAVWDDPSVAWSDFDAVILRSTWDYHRRQAEFLAWVDALPAMTQVWNPPPLVRWNSHKAYLADLEGWGVPTVPSELVLRESPRTLESVLTTRSWSDVVVKPAVGADADRLRVVSRQELSAGESHLLAVLSHGDALVQPFQGRVRTAGERSLVFFDGAFSHAVEHGFVLEVSSRLGRATPAQPAAREDAARLLARLPTPPLYARVDFLPGPGDRWLVSELELIEPDLYFRTDPRAPGRFADALLDRLRRGA
jgi:hypothetical protein